MYSRIFFSHTKSATSNCLAEWRECRNEHYRYSDPRTYQDNKLRALVSVTVDGDLAVHDIKVIEGAERLFVAMPSRKDDNGVFRDIAHPITPEARQYLEGKILKAYEDILPSRPAGKLHMPIKWRMRYQNQPVRTALLLNSRSQLL